MLMYRTIRLLVNLHGRWIHCEHAYFSLQYNAYNLRIGAKTGSYGVVRVLQMFSHMFGLLCLPGVSEGEESELAEACAGE